MIIKWPPLLVGALAFEPAGRYGRIAEYRHLHIADWNTNVSCDKEEGNQR